MKYIKTFEGFLGESKYKGNIAGDAAKYIAKELSQYVKGIISQPNDSVTYFHVNDKSDKSKVIKTLLDVYGIEAVDGGNMFTSSPTIKFDNDQLLESINKGLVNENKPVNAESDIIEKIKKLLPHMHQRDADHNAKVMLKQYKDGTLKSGVIYNQIKKLIK